MSMSIPSRECAGWSREDIARNVAEDIPDGSVVNLGIGIPELVTGYIPPGREIVFHTENGLLGMGPPPMRGLEDPELINAGKRFVTAVPGAAYFDHASSFAMIRGGHIDICVLGAMQVSQRGDLANWSLGDDDAAPAVGGAMDLVSGVETIFVATTHCTHEGRPKLVESCIYPITGVNSVARIYTDLAILEVCDDGLKVLQMAPGIDFDILQHCTEAQLLKIGLPYANRSS
jgi:3-oxoadipate CoA-transferase beta subunit